MSSRGAKNTAVSNSYPQLWHDHVCRTQRSLKYSDQSGASSHSPHWGQWFLLCVAKRVRAAVSACRAMIQSSLNPNHPLPIIRLEAFRGGGKTDLRRYGGHFTENSRCIATAF